MPVYLYFHWVSGLKQASASTGTAVPPQAGGLQQDPHLELREKQKCTGRALWGAGNRNLEVLLANTVMCLSDLCSGACSILPA